MTDQPAPTTVGLLQRTFAQETADQLDQLARAVEDLDLEALHHLPHPEGNSIGFDAWHAIRTVDNIINFAFHRERPVWLQQGLDKEWDLPRVENGTGMAVDEAQALRFPGGEALAAYARDVRDSVVPLIEALSDEFLAEEMEIKFVGMRARARTISNTVIVHAGNHLGRIDLARGLLGKPGLGV